MGSLEKLSEVTRLFDEKRGAMLKRVGRVMVECKAVEEHFKMMEDFGRLCHGELESKEKYLRGVQKTVKQSSGEFDLKKRSMEEGLKRLDEKEKFLKRVLREMEDEEMKFAQIRDAFDRQMNDVVVKEEELKSLFEALKLFESEMKQRKQERDSKEKWFLSQVEKREKDLDSKEKMIQSQVEIREKELDSKEKLIQNQAEEKGKELELEKKTLEAEVNLMLKSKQNEIDAEEKRLAIRSNDLDSREKNLVGREKELEEKLVNLAKQLEEKEGILESNNLEDAMSQTHSAEVSKPVRNGACLFHEEQKMEEVSSKLGKRSSCIRDKNSGQDIRAAEKGKLARNIGVGEIWACFESFDAKDNLPRSYAKVSEVIDHGGQVWVEVAWLEPCPVQRVEQEWIGARLPVTCGKFESGRTSVESPTIFSHPMSCARYDPCIIIPCEEETWVLYKDWDIKTWSTNARLHRHCKYEIVEILPYFKNESSALGVRVAYLDKIRGSLKSFKRRGESYNASLLIGIENLYSFSHKVPSIKRICIDDDGTLRCEFELDLKCLPSELQ